MLVATFACTCDVCGALISHKSQAVDQDLNLRFEPRVFEMHMCKICEEIAREAVFDALESRKVAQSMRRSS